MTLTARLSLFFLAALATVLVAFSVALYAIADYHLHRQLDDRLRAEVLQMAAAAEVKPDGVEWEPHSRPHALSSSSFGEELYWVLTDGAGNVIDRSPQPDAPQLLADADRGFQTGHRNPRRVEHGDRAWQAARLRMAPATPPAGPLKPDRYTALVITVAVPLDPVYATLRALAATLAALTLVTLGVALVAGRTVCRRVLAPVARMAAAARSMGASELSERLPSGAAADELADLARAFNGLLDRLGEAFERGGSFAGEASHQLRTPLAAAHRTGRGRAPPGPRAGRVPPGAGVGSGPGRAVAARGGGAPVPGPVRCGRALPGLERVDLAAWVPARLRAWTSGPRGGDLEVDRPPAEAAALIHPDLFGELLDAVLDNAFKYSAPGTPVVVRIGGDPRDVWVQVEDHGCGIAPADLPHLFRPFFRAEQARTCGVPGVGLGLAVAARIAAALDGSISAASEGRRGCRITVRLPAAARRPAPLETLACAPAEAPSSQASQPTRPVNPG
ncbi:sensor histidine kinase [Frigoriglobus tundricola]|uniref:histidine kinase n=1 Tax=Frigoriglobus tundricola TaxID=2774151 RepID=A0A6M5Z0S9_9BACT|nr:ATP-binding protein [Frigoriglobus tundricola]QJW99939.1 Two-component system sensor histidine kinase [Frigoriglobus tundricola]